jgi:chromosome segregation protein
MQLKQLKLAGFKSFVDPTVLTFPSPLVAVVGPNGCGKSNIIDAIRWVMGESSAKHLRGDSMIDVIFNGSSHRKPVGQASVELVFDNSLGRVLGPFASYGEIAVKRVLTRDGESTYYLNGARCRRRDVMDIFLGTGAGVRGYSIISQGDVSRLIEAKPEALRGYLEEAAGVSKYKERRRETMTRIQHTRDNLLRIADIREEMGKQLQRLEKQGKAAEQYLQLKAEERLCRAEILALKWRELTKTQLLKQETLQVFAKTHTTEQLKTIAYQKEKDLLEIKRQQLDQQINDIQKSFYLSGSEISRLQEGLGQFQRENDRLMAEKQQLHRDNEKTSSQIQVYKTQLENANEKITLLDNRLLELNQVLLTQEELTCAAIQQQVEVDHQYNLIQSNTHNIKKDAEIAEVNWNNNEQRYQQTLIRLEKLDIEIAAMDINHLEENGLELIKQHTILTSEQIYAEEQLRLKQTQIVQYRSEIAQIEQHLRQLQDANYQTKTQHAALNAAQGAAVQPVKEYPIKAWLQKPRLVDKLQVEQKWQFAFEYVVGDQLKALILDDSEEFISQINLIADIGENMVTLASSSTLKGDTPRLSDKILGEHPLLTSNLDSIYTADNLEAAIAYRVNLKPQESIITPEGVWLGWGWVRVPKRSAQDSLGLLARQQKITDLATQLAQEQTRLENLRLQRDKAHEQLQIEEKIVQTLEKNRQYCLEALRSHENKQAINAKSLQLAKTRKHVLDEESQELKETLEDLIINKHILMESKQQCIDQWKILEQELQHLVENKQLITNRVVNLKKEGELLKADLHKNTLEQDRALNQINQTQEGIIREQERVDIFHTRLEITAQQLMDTELQQRVFQQKLTQAIKDHQLVEGQLLLCREQLTEEKQAIESLELVARQQQLHIKTIEDNITRERLEEQSLKVRVQALEESLQEQSLRPSDLLINLSDSLTPNLREKALSVMMDNITKLGAINLAAIDEYIEERTRKENLDTQYNDLQKALLMLEAAIEQMDKETQLRLGNTFEQVNDLFKALFPRLFGGGRAHLELTSNNLLEAGVVVMAQPPGKRNTSIQLLSGGEKAMTALALVFAIFQLNPSPFCMLDEVDAPLDDVNVVRFCNVVKEMSKFVQFLFITHNKVTMELAEQLIGVTMREPGVSRLVTVDVVDIKETILE